MERHDPKLVVCHQYEFQQPSHVRKGGVRCLTLNTDIASGFECASVLVPDAAWLHGRINGLEHVGPTVMHVSHGVVNAPPRNQNFCRKNKQAQIFCERLVRNGHIQAATEGGLVSERRAGWCS